MKLDSLSDLKRSRSTTTSNFSLLSYFLLIFSLVILGLTLNTGMVQAQDADADGILDANDNCVNNTNPGQEDVDNDGAGDPCDSSTLNSQYHFNPADLNQYVSNFLIQARLKGKLFEVRPNNGFGVATKTDIQDGDTDVLRMEVIGYNADVTGGPNILLGPRPSGSDRQYTWQGTNVDQLGAGDFLQAHYGCSSNACGIGYEFTDASMVGEFLVIVRISPPAASGWRAFIETSSGIQEVTPTATTNVSGRILIKDASGSNTLFILSAPVVAALGNEECLADDANQGLCNTPTMDGNPAVDLFGITRAIEETGSNTPYSVGPPGNGGIEVDNNQISQRIKSFQDTRADHGTVELAMINFATKNLDGSFNIGLRTPLGFVTATQAQTNRYGYAFDVTPVVDYSLPAGNVTVNVMHMVGFNSEFDANWTGSNVTYTWGDCGPPNQYFDGAVPNAGTYALMPNGGGDAMDRSALDVSCGFGLSGSRVIADNWTLNGGPNGNSGVGFGPGAIVALGHPGLSADPQRFQGADLVQRAEVTVGGLTISNFQGCLGLGEGDYTFNKVTCSNAIDQNIVDDDGQKAAGGVGVASNSGDAVTVNPRTNDFVANFPTASFPCGAGTCIPTRGAGTKVAPGTGETNVTIGQLDVQCQSNPLFPTGTGLATAVEKGAVTIGDPNAPLNLPASSIDGCAGGVAAGSAPYTDAAGTPLDRSSGKPLAQVSVNNMKISNSDTAIGIGGAVDAKFQHISIPGTNYNQFIVGNDQNNLDCSSPNTLREFAAPFACNGGEDYLAAIAGGINWNTVASCDDCNFGDSFVGAGTKPYGNSPVIAQIDSVDSVDREIVVDAGGPNPTSQILGRTTAELDATFLAGVGQDGAIELTVRNSNIRTGSPALVCDNRNAACPYANISFLNNFYVNAAGVANPSDPRIAVVVGDTDAVTEDGEITSNQSPGLNVNGGVSTVGDGLSDLAKDTIPGVGGCGDLTTLSGKVCLAKTILIDAANQGLVKEPLKNVGVSMLDKFENSVPGNLNKANAMSNVALKLFEPANNQIANASLQALYNDTVNAARALAGL